MLKTQFAAIAAILLAVVATAMPASANSNCRMRGCAEAVARAAPGRVKTVYRTVYVQQVRDVVRVHNVYRDWVVHAQPERHTRQAPQRTVAYAGGVHPPHLAPYRVMNHGVVHYGMMHPHWVPNGMTHCNCGGYQNAGYYHPGYYRHR